MLKKISIRSALLVLLAVMTLLLLMVSVMGITAIHKGNQSLDAIQRIQGVELNALYITNGTLLRARATAAQAIRELETGHHDRYAATAKRSASYVEQSRQEMQKFIEAGTVTAHGKKLAEAIAARYAVYVDTGITPMIAALQKEDTGRYYALLEGNISELAVKFADAVADFDRYADEVSTRQLAQAAHNQRLMTLLIIFSGVLTLVLVALSWWLLRALLLWPLERAITHLEYVAGGDLTRPLPAAGRNELGRLNAALATMQQSLQQSVSLVRDASLQIDVGSRELATGNLNLSQRTEESAASLEETAASMEQLTATVQQNAENARQAHQLARSVSGTADRGAEVVCYVIEKMSEIAGSSRRIGDILEVIDGIAFQTNILALNASVEAARAGEQGRGFAVVASEVRTLAQRSATAAKEIRALISDSQARVNEGNSMATKAGETMDEISGEVMRVTTLMKEISSASDEQRNGIEQVNEAVTRMDEVAQQNAALVEQAAAATQSLEEQARRLVETTAVFKVA